MLPRYANGAGDPVAIYDYLSGHLDAGHPRTAGVLWRLARACHHVAATCDHDKKRKEELTRQGVLLAKEALEADSSNFACHKWMAIMISDVGEFDGTKAQLLNSFIMRVRRESAIVRGTCSLPAAPGSTLTDALAFCRRGQTGIAAPRTTFWRPSG